MNKRIRKKHHLREFTEMGFEVVAPEAFTSYDKLDQLIDLMEALGLGIGGSAAGAFVTRCHGSVTENERLAIMDWFAEQGWACVASPLRDAWYPDGAQPGTVHPRAVLQ